MDAIVSGTAGLISAAQRFNISAQGFVSGDPVTGVTGLISSKTDFEASAKVIKVADEMLGALLDIKV